MERRKLKEFEKKRLEAKERGKHDEKEAGKLRKSTESSLFHTAYN